MTIASEQQKLAPSAIIELFVLDATSAGGSVLRFHGGVNELGTDVVWQGNTYSRMPIEADGFDQRGSGTIPRPTIKVANIGGLVAAEAKASADFVGCAFTRKRTFARFLDAVNFAAGNPEADPNQYFPDEIYFVDRKSNENPVYIEFELAAAIDLPGTQLPRAQVIQSTCTWIYRSAECGYVGTSYFDQADNPVGTAAQDVCGKRLSSCKARPWPDGVINFGGFPGAGLAQ